MTHQRLKNVLLSLLTASSVLMSSSIHAQVQGVDKAPTSGGISIDVGSIFRILSDLRNKPTIVDENYETGQVQVLWMSDEQANTGITFIENSHHVKPISVEHLNNLGVVIALYQLPKHSAAVRMRDELRQAHPDWTVDLNAIQTPQGPRLYALSQMNFPANPSIRSNTLKKFRLGVIDGPFNNDASLLTATQVQHSVLPNEDQAASANHGNSVASLIAGTPLKNGFTGAAPNINLIWAVATRQINGRESTNSFLMSKALDWLIGQRVTVINISMGGAGDSVLAVVFRQVESKHVVVVAAAGNGGANAAPAYPAAYPSVLAVTAVDAAEQVYRQANRGDYIDVAGAGVDVWAPTSGYVSGTSFASALVAGALAQLGGASSKSSAQKKLCAHAKDLGGAGRDNVFGCGLVQLK